MIIRLYRSAGKDEQKTRFQLYFSDNAHTTGTPVFNSSVYNRSTAFTTLARFVDTGIRPTSNSSDSSRYFLRAQSARPLSSLRLRVIVPGTLARIPHRDRVDGPSSLRLFDWSAF